jgi:hypothetical protein
MQAERLLLPFRNGMMLGQCRTRLNFGMDVLKTFYPLGCFYSWDPNGNPNFQDVEIGTWDCPSCKSALVAVYIKRDGAAPSEHGFVVCPVCSDSSVSVRSASSVHIQVVADGKTRLTREQYEAVLCGT